MIIKWEHGHFDVLRGARLVASRDRRGWWTLHTAFATDALLNDVARVEREHPVQRPAASEVTP